MKSTEAKAFHHKVIRRKLVYPTIILIDCRCILQ